MRMRNGVFGGTAAHTVVPIILAAGDSSRMGYPKALLPLGAGTFLTTILGRLEKLSFPVPRVILGRDAARIQPLIASRRCSILINTDPSRGQLSSVQLGVASLDPNCDGCLIWPVDLPAVAEGILSGLVDLFLSSHALIVLPRCGDRRGHPVIFRRNLFKELLDIPAGERAKKLLQVYRDQIVELPTSERATIEDIDTPEDYRRLTSETVGAALSRTSRE